MRTRPSILLALLLLVGTPAAHCEEPPKPPPKQHELLAEELVKAHAANEATRIAEIANGTGLAHDPFRIADFLLETKRLEAARALAAAATRPDLARLAEYVEAQIEKPRSAAARAAYDKMRLGRHGRSYEDKLELFATVDVEFPDVPSVLTLYLMGNEHYVNGNPADAITSLMAGGDIAAHIGWVQLAATLYSLAGAAATEAKDEQAAIEAFTRQMENEVSGTSELGRTSAATIRPILMRRLMKLLTGQVGASEEEGTSFLRGLPSGQILADLARCSPNASTTWFLAVALQLDGQANRARRLLEDIRDRTDHFGNKTDAAVLGYTLGQVYLSTGRPSQGLETLEVARAAARKLEMTGVETLATTVASLSAATLGEYERALSLAAEGLALVEKTGARIAEPVILTTMGRCMLNQGHYHLALRHLDRAREMHVQQGSKADAVAIGMEIGNAHHAMGDLEKAREMYTSARELSVGIEDLSGELSALANVGVLDMEEGSFDEAEQAFREVISRARANDRPTTLAVSLANLADLHRNRGRLADAAATQAEAVALAKEQGLSRILGDAQADLALIDLDRSRFPEARKSADASLELARAMGSLPMELRARSALTLIEHRQSRHAPAMAAARRLAAALREVAGRVADTPAARTRSRFSHALEAGALSAAALKRNEDFAFFLETGRAGLLREALGGRRALAEANLPADLRRREREARERLARAVAEATRLKGDFKASRAANAEVVAARDALAQTIERIEGEVRQSSELLYADVESLDRIRAKIGEDKACVLFGFFEEDAFALRITAQETELVALGATTAIEQALDQLRRASDPEHPLGDAPAKARELVWKPLRLEGKRRVLVSPDGALCVAPPALVFPESVDVVYLPSGTWHARTKDLPARAGERVLALGDPAYANPARRLPESKAEAQAVGDDVLLGADATKQALRERLGSQKHWRAVHLACHGRVDAQRPALSRLELTPGATGDGILVALEVHRLRVPADLVVLSACETGLGRYYRGTGMLGFTRAFLSAGSSRVLCSLWKVDDKATRVLMEKFYELWNPEDGKGALGAATALRKAQEFVRTRDRATVAKMRGTEGRPAKTERPWSHPYFWAGWVLWGRP